MASLFDLVEIFGKLSCDDICKLDDKLKIQGPVCGSDGKTYNTKCALRKAVCRSRKTVSIVHYGEFDNCASPALFSFLLLLLQSYNLAPHYLIDLFKRDSHSYSSYHTLKNLDSELRITMKKRQMGKNVSYRGTEV